MSTLAVYDCMLFFARAARPERARETFRLVERNLVTLCLSAEVLEEIHNVLTREEYRSRFPSLTPEAVAVFLSDINSRSQLIENVAEVYTLERDPKDSKYVNLALAAGAKFLVTRDKDLLALMNSATPSGRDFQQRFPELLILEPAAFVQQIEAANTRAAGEK